MHNFTPSNDFYAYNTTKLTCHYRARRNSGQVQRLVYAPACGTRDRDVEDFKIIGGREPFGPELKAEWLMRWLVRLWRNTCRTSYPRT